MSENKKWQEVAKEMDEVAGKINSEIKSFTTKYPSAEPILVEGKLYWKIDIAAL